MERLRDVARAGHLDQDVLVREAAGALAGLGDDPGGLVLSCKRLVERHPTSGPLWWLCARLLESADTRAEAWRCAEAVAGDTTPRHLAAVLPEDALVTVVGWPELVAETLHWRGDLEVLVVDAQGEGAAFVRRLVRAEVAAVEVPESGTAAAAAVSDVVVLEASALGSESFLAPSGSRAAAAVAHAAGVPVWLVAGVGRALPDRLWQAVTARLDLDSPWDSEMEIVPLDLVDAVLGPEEGVVVRPDCPAAPELLD